MSLFELSGSQDTDPTSATGAQSTDLGRTTTRPPYSGKSVESIGVGSGPHGAEPRKERTALSSAINSSVTNANMSSRHPSVDSSSSVTFSSHPGKSAHNINAKTTGSKAFNSRQTQPPFQPRPAQRVAAAHPYVGYRGSSGARPGGRQVTGGGGGIRRITPTAPLAAIALGSQTPKPAIASTPPSVNVTPGDAPRYWKPSSADGLSGEAPQKPCGLQQEEEKEDKQPQKIVLKQQQAKQELEQEQQQQLPSVLASNPKKRKVQEVTKVIFPEGFFPKNEEGKTETEEDLYSKLAKLWDERGGWEQVFQSEVSPDAIIDWQTKFVSRVPPPFPPSEDSPSVSSVSSDYAYQSQARRMRGEAVTEVYADSRYVGVSVRHAKLVPQSTKTMNKLGPLDLATFRNYRDLPIDYFVAELKGLELQGIASREASPSTGKKEETPRGRTRRPRRSAREKKSPAASPEREKDKGKRKLRKTSVFIGKRCQIEVPPYVANKSYSPDPAIVPKCDQVWDPQRAAEAEKRGEDIQGFLDQAGDFTTRALLMEALHIGGYSTERAHEAFVDLYRQSKEPSSMMHDSEEMLAKSLLKRNKKEFGTIARNIKRSVSTVLVQYYRWKRENFNGDYSRLKDLCKAEEDICSICEEGGVLIVCDNCHKAFHLKCLKPPLEAPPEKDCPWYCNQCAMKSPAKLRRIPSISLASTPGSTDQGSSAKPAARKALIYPTDNSDFGGEVVVGPPVIRGTGSSLQPAALGSTLAPVSNEQGQKGATAGQNNQGNIPTPASPSLPTSQPEVIELLT